MIETKDIHEDNSLQPCSCLRDPFAVLPPELMPRPAARPHLLRDVICPGCGLVYQTNRHTDLCMDCERKGVRRPEAPVIGEP